MSTYSVYLLTNKVTHARAAVVARTAEAAVKTHPTDDLASYHGGQWVRWRNGRAMGGFHGFVAVEAPEGWPVDLRLVHADLVAYRTEGPIGLGSLAYQPSLELRQPGEGPDDSWGGYSLRDLGGRYTDYTDESLGPLFDGAAGALCKDS